MLKLNVMSFINAIKEAEESDPQEYHLIGLSYLESHVTIPYLLGFEVRLDELDFNAFDYDDTEISYRNSIDLSDSTSRLRSVLLSILAAPPMANHNVRFV